MRFPKLLTSLAVLTMLTASPTAVPLFAASPAMAQEAQVSFSIFFDRLRPHGLWVKNERYRYVFCPKVDAGWRPYTHGRWVYLRDRGWYFSSREPFAWALYHYGRWIDDDRLGWCWVPGNHWAPAWVSWRRSKDYVGWAPLPPEEDGFQVRIEIASAEPPRDRWFFVPVRSFVEPDLSVDIVFGNRDPEVFQRTEFVGPVVVQNNVVINNVIDIDFIQQQTQTTVQVVEAQPVEDPEQAAAEPVDGATVPVFAPQVEEPEQDAAPPEAVEPDQAAQQLPQAQEQSGEGEPATEQPAGEQLPADQQQPADEQTSTEQPADAAAPAEPAPAGEAQPEQQAPAEQAVPADQAPADQKAEDCPEGQQMVDGKCVPTEEQQPEQAAPAEEAPAPAGQPAEEQPAPADQPAPAEEPAPAEQSAPAEQPAPAEEAKPADEQPAPAEEAAPSEEQAPADQPQQCPDGTQLVDGKCIPVPAEQAPAQ